MGLTLVRGGGAIAAEATALRVLQYLFAKSQQSYAGTTSSSSVLGGLSSIAPSLHRATVLQQQQQEHQHRRHPSRHQPPQSQAPATDTSRSLRSSSPAGVLLLRFAAVDALAATLALATLESLSVGAATDDVLAGDGAVRSGRRRNSVVGDLRKGRRRSVDGGSGATAGAGGVGVASVSPSRSEEHTSNSSHQCG
jgi:hypothetical protein